MHRMQKSLKASSMHETIIMYWASIFKRYYKHMHTQITFEICTHVAQIKLDMRLAFELRV